MAARATYWTAAIAADKTHTLDHPATLRTTFSFGSQQEATVVLHAAEVTQGANVDSWLAGIPNSPERIALMSLSYNGVLAASPALKADIVAGNRAEAWWEIRYDTNLGATGASPPGDAAAVATRRYYESQEFGLYNPGPVTNAEALQIYQMVTHHDAGGLADPKSMDSYDFLYDTNLTSPGVANANANYNVTSVQHTQDALNPAAQFLVDNYMAGTAEVIGIWVVYTGITTLDFHASTVANLLIGGATGDTLLGGNGNDWLYGGAGNDTLNGGAGINTASYAQDPAGVTVNLATGKATDGWHNTDTLTNIQNIMGSAFNDTLTGDSHNNVFYGTAGSDRISGGPAGGAGSDTIDYTSLAEAVSVSYVTDHWSIVKGDGSAGTDSATSIQNIVGTEFSDTFAGFASPPSGLTFSGGGGSDHYNFDIGAAIGHPGGLIVIAEAAVPGIDTVSLQDLDATTDVTITISYGGGIHPNILLSFYEPFQGVYASLSFNVSTTGDGYGVENVQIGNDIIRGSSLYQFGETTNFSPLNSLAASILGFNSPQTPGSGGQTLPVKDSNGNITGQEVSPLVGQAYASYSYATELEHTFVVTSVYIGGTASVVTYQTYPEQISFASGIHAQDVRLTTVEGVVGQADLVVHLDSLGTSFTLPNFETGQTLSGIGLYTPSLHAAIQSATSSTLTDNGNGAYTGNYEGGGFSAFTWGNVTEVYHLDSLAFADGTVINLHGGLNLANDSSGGTLYGTDAFGDTLTAGGTGNNSDALYGNGGADTLVAGVGTNYLYGGTGGDTYVFNPGFGNSYLFENAGTDVNAIKFTGVLPGQVREWTDYAGDLLLQNIADPAHSITVYGGVTGNGTYESAIGQYVEKVVFDNGTVWSLTGGLNLANDVNGGTLYGTAFGDTLTAGGTGNNSDALYGNGGADTLVAGVGTNYLYGGTGGDTYVFNPGFGNSYIYENAGTDVNAIKFTGVLPGQVREWTDYAGDLLLQNIADPAHSITVYGGVTGNGTYESAIGQYVEKVVFDNGTVWSLTGGLNLANDVNGGTLYGTAFGDTLTAGGTGNNSDALYGNGGADTLVAGVGTNYLYGGTGGDTYVFNPGFGNSYIYENAGTDVNAIKFTGVLPGQVREWTDYAGDLLLQNIADPAHSITVYGGVTGNGTYESAIGQYVEKVVFDNGTVWSLTGGLILANDVNGGTLYGTAFGDTLTAGGTGNNSDALYGNGGADTLVAGVGTNYLYGGTGGDTYVFNPGFGNSYLFENAGTDVNAIKFTGVLPGQVREWTDYAGDLLLQNIADPAHSITVYGGVTGNGTYESAIGQYVEKVVFDNGTVWSLTGGLNLANDVNGGTLYGTAFGDTLTAGGSVNSSSALYGNAGNDTLVAGPGADYMDGGTGVNTASYALSNAGVIINLAAGTASGYGADTLVNISNAIGSIYNDTFVSSSGNNVFTGNGGTDTVSYAPAVAGVTINLATGIATGDGTDTLLGITNAIGSSHNDVFISSSGSNVFTGNGGVDTVSYAAATAGVTVNLATGLATGHGTDTLNGISNVIGSAYNDSFISSSGNNVFTGGGGVDTVSYAAATNGVTVDLATGVATGHGTDTLSGISNITGSAYNDTFISGSGNNVFTGNGGIDTVSYIHAAGGVTIDLHAGTATGDGTDSLIGILNAIGSTHNDIFVSSSGNNVFTGGGGVDTVSYAAAAAGVTVNLATNTATGDGTDSFSALSNVTGSTHADTITGNSGANVIDGGGGADTLYGGTGADTFMFKALTALNASVTIGDFSTSQADKLNIADVLAGHYNPLQDAISNFVQVTTSGSSTILKVDIDGTGTAHTWQQIATLSGVTGHDLNDLLTHGNLVVS